MKYIEILKQAQKDLTIKSILNPALDSELILSNILKIKRENLLLNLPEDKIPTSIRKFEYELKLKYAELMFKNNYDLLNKKFWPRKDTVIEYDEGSINILYEES